MLHQNKTLFLQTTLIIFTPTKVIFEKKNGFQSYFMSILFDPTNDVNVVALKRLGGLAHPAQLVQFVFG